MIEGKKGALIFLLTPYEYVSQEYLSLIDTSIPALQLLTSLPTHQTILQCVFLEHDILASCDMQSGVSWRKQYPDNVILLSIQGQRPEDTSGNYVDYLLNKQSLVDQVKGIILAERSRRQLINSKEGVRHCFEYTVTAIVLNEERTHMLMIHRPNNQWFPPGGHVGVDEYPHEALNREVEEETGYTIAFIDQPEHVGKQVGTTHLLPQPQWILLERLTTHYHHDLLYLCTVLGSKTTRTEYEWQWVELSRVSQLAVTDDIKDIVLSIISTNTSSGAR